MPFKIHDWVSHPAHGAGQITDIEEHTIEGTTFSTYVIPYGPTATHGSMTLRVPVGKKELRRLIPKKDIPKLLKVLGNPVRKLDRNWTKRKRGLEAKLFSGDIFAVAQVVRDTYKPEGVEWSYSEHDIYTTALSMVTREIAASEGISADEAMAKTMAKIQKAHTQKSL